MRLSTQDLEKRGWTKGLIKKFLPEPSDVQYFSRYGCRYFYSIPRVEAIERIAEFKTLQAKALKKRNAGKSSAENRKQKYLFYLKYEMPVRVKALDAEMVRLQAINAYNHHRADRRWRDFERGRIDDYELENFREAGTDSDTAFLERITVNYIRHNLTSYDNLLASLHGKLAQAEAARIIQTRVFEAVIEAYPNFRAECERQMIARKLLAPV